MTRMCHSGYFTTKFIANVGDRQMNWWYYFWVFDFCVAGGAFVLILAVVAVRGVADLREMLAALHREGRTGDPR